MASPRETLKSLEEKIKIPPGDPHSERALRSLLTDADAISIAERKLLIRQWLLKQGIPEASSKNSLAESLSQAYCIPNYLRNWRNRVNPSFALLGDSDEDEIEIAEAAKPAPAPATQEAASGGLSAAQTERWLKDLYTQIEKSVTSLVTDRLNRTEIKLSDNVKGQIKDLAKGEGEAAAKRLVEELMPPRQIEIVDRAKGTAVNIGHQHEKFPTLLRACGARNHEGNRLNIWLSGPTGSGKTTACRNAAKALGLDFEAEGSLDVDFKLMGYMDGNGKYVETAFYRKVKHGGMILLDEIDNYGPSALLSANACLGNGFVQFPCGFVEKHPDCIIVAAANTWGLGATNDYVGRSRLDAATLDRFSPKIYWGYDEALERAIAHSQGDSLGISWFNVVRSTREKVKAQGLKIIVSPRSTYNGIALLQQGFAAKDVVEMTLGAGISPEQFKAIGLHLIDVSAFENLEAVA